MERHVLQKKASERLFFLKKILKDSLAGKNMGIVWLKHYEIF